MSELRTDAARRFHRSYHTDRGQRCPIVDGDTPSVCYLAENLSLIETSAAAAPTPDELDQLMADISASGYASEAVEVVERWTRAKWGVESAFTTRLVAERAAERERAKPRFGHPEGAR